MADETSTNQITVALDDPPSIPITAKPSLYVHNGTLEPEDVGVIRIPKCSDGFQPFAIMAFSWIVLTIILPIINLSIGEYTFDVLGFVLLGIGLVQCCFISSFRTLLVDGVFCKPTPPAKTPTWTCGPDPLSNEGDKLLESAEEGRASPAKRTIKNIKVIVNPNAGVTKKGQSKLDVCKAAWESKGIKVTVLATTHAGHGKEIAYEEDLSDCDALCAIGGDGTLHEVTNGFLSGLSDREEKLKVPEWWEEDKEGDLTDEQKAEWDAYTKEKSALEARRNTALGFCPGGSGNSVLCDFGTWDLKTAADIISEGKVCKMDYNVVSTGGENIASINTIIFGLIGDIGVIAEDFRWMGPSRYENVAGFKLLCGYKQKVKLTMMDKDGNTTNEEDEFLTCFINQTQHFGKGLRGEKRPSVPSWGGGVSWEEAKKQYLKEVGR